MNGFFKRFPNPGLLTLAGLAIALAPQALKADPPQLQCSNATMNGIYVMSGSGSIVGLGPIASVGFVTYDGHGDGVSTTTTSVNGVASQSTTTGSFTVNGDCSGTKTFGSGPAATHFNFVITPDGAQITWIVTNAGVVMTGTAVRVLRGL